METLLKEFRKREKTSRWKRIVTSLSAHNTSVLNGIEGTEREEVEGARSTQGEWEKEKIGFSRIRRGKGHSVFAFVGALD